MDKKAKLRKIRNVLIILIIILLIGVPLFEYFKLKTESRLALREAKNVNIYLQMLDVELYSEGKCVYDGNKRNGLSAGTLERIQDYLENDCEVIINSYSKKLRRVTGFTYKRGNYQVEYRYDDVKGNCWKITYQMKIAEYDGD